MNDWVFEDDIIVNEVFICLSEYGKCDWKWLKWWRKERERERKKLPLNKHFLSTTKKATNQEAWQLLAK